jgi:hypothetical protein
VNLEIMLDLGMALPPLALRIPTGFTRQRSHSHVRPGRDRRVVSPPERCADHPAEHLADRTAGEAVEVRVDALLAFGAALLTLRLAGELARRYRARREPQFAAWSASLLAYALASAALAWGAAAGWDEPTFRAYYLFGGLLTAPLLGVGSLLLWGRNWAAPLGLLYTGLAVGLALAVPLTRAVSGETIPEAQEHLDLVPARLVAILGNSLGTLAVLAVALVTLRRRPLGNVLVLGGVAVAAIGSGLAGLGVAETAGFVAGAAVLLYLGFVAPVALPRSYPSPPKSWLKSSSSGR